jgi:hypothetical protein
MTRPTPAENLQSINNQRPIPAFRKDEPVYIPFKIERKPTKSETSGIEKKRKQYFPVQLSSSFNSRFCRMALGNDNRKSYMPTGKKSDCTRLKSFQKEIENHIRLLSVVFGVAIQKAGGKVWYCDEDFYLSSI